jgi:hypothetical protein
MYGIVISLGFGECRCYLVETRRALTLVNLALTRVARVAARTHAAVAARVVLARVVVAGARRWHCTLVHVLLTQPPDPALRAHALVAEELVHARGIVEARRAGAFVHLKTPQ